MSSITTISYEQIKKLGYYRGINDIFHIDVPKDYIATVPKFIEDANKYMLFRVHPNIIFNIVVNKMFMSEKQMKLFAIFCASQMSEYIKDKKNLVYIKFILYTAKLYVNDLNNLVLKKKLENISEDYTQKFKFEPALDSDVMELFAIFAANAVILEDKDLENVVYALNFVHKLGNRCFYHEYNIRYALTLYENKHYQRVNYLLDLFERGANFD